MSPRRQVRVSDAFFVQLDNHFASDRGNLGEASATDFLVFELPTLVEHFATDFESLPLAVQGVPSCRMLITRGLLVPFVAVFGVLTESGVIELIGLTVDMGGVQ